MHTKPNNPIVNPLLPKQTLLVDVETTGLDPARHSIIELAMLTPDGTSHFVQSCRPWIGAAIDPEALAVNGWSAKQLESVELSHSEAMQQAADWLGTGTWTVAGMNPHFDLKFLQEAFARVLPRHKRPRFSHRVYDLHSLTRFMYPFAESLISQDIAILLGIDPEAEPHRALGGIQWEAAAFRKLHMQRHRLFGEEGEPKGHAA